MKRFSLTFSAFLLTLPAYGTIVTVAEYRFGDSDPGAVAGNAVNATTVDSSGNGNTMNLAGSATYVTTPSGLGISLNGSSAGFSRAVVSTLLDDFGMEVLVSSNNTPFNGQTIFYNGNTGANGWGFYQTGGIWGVLMGGRFYQGTAVIPNQWVALALVRAGGITTFYVNGVSQYTTAVSPATPSGSLVAGDGNFSFPPASYFSGQLDRARVFTFSAGGFSTGDLMGPVPEPATWTMIGLGLTLARYVRRKKPRAA